MKKVMFFCPVFYPENSGYSNAFQQLIGSILDHLPDYYITVLTPLALSEGKNELERERLRVIRLKPKLKIKKIRYFFNEFFWAKEISKLFIQEKYDFLLVETFENVVFLNSLDQSIYQKMAVRIHSTSETEYTFFSKGFDFAFKRFFIKRRLKEKVNWFLSTNKFHINFAKEYFFDGNLVEVASKNFMVLPTPINSIKGIDFDSGEKYKIFYMGRMSYLGANQKGFIDLIYAIKLLQRSVIDKLEFTLVGQGELRPQLIELSKGIKNINFIESMTHPEVMHALSHSDAVILPSRYEGLSMFALEGLASGNVCLFSRVGGLVDLIEGNGFFYEPQDIESIASVLLEFSKLSSDQLSRMKEKSISLADKRFSPSAVATKFQNIVDIVSNNSSL